MTFSLLMRPGSARGTKTNPASDLRALQLGRIAKLESIPAGKAGGEIAGLRPNRRCHQHKRLGCRVAVLEGMFAAGCFAPRRNDHLGAGTVLGRRRNRAAWS